MLARAISLAALKFLNIEDKGGAPYILHCLWVMHKVRHLGNNFMQVAVLHDIVEDTDVSLEDLLKMGFDFEIVEAVKLLTRTEDISYDLYIKKIASNDLARQVKLRDLEHNSKITRLKGVTPKDLIRVAKYHKSYKLLEVYRK